MRRGHIFKPAGDEDAGFFCARQESGRSRFVTPVSMGRRRTPEVVKFGGNYEAAPGDGGRVGGGMVSTRRIILSVRVDAWRNGGEFER